MDFLTSQPDLTQTIFTESHLQSARTYLESWIKREKSSWLNKPQGPFGEYWRKDDAESACHLIDLAQMMDTITKNLSPESVPRFNKKIKENLLPRPADIKQFYETLTELQAAYKLISCIRPIPLTWEPPIPGQRRSPDIAFQLPEGIVYLDVTVFHGGPLERWEEAKEKVRAATSKRTINREKAINVDIQIPFETIKIDPIIKQVLDGMDELTTGEVRVGSKGMIRWEPFPILEVQNTSSIPEISSFAGGFHTPGATMDIAFGSQASIAAPLPEDIEKANKSFFNSVCNKLREKHDQFPRNHPSLYIMKLGHWALNPGLLLNMLQAQIWQKDDYRWITGIIFFTPRQGFLKTDEDAKWIPSFNPRAKCQASESLRSIFWN